MGGLILTILTILPVCDGVVDPPATGHVAGLVTRYYETAHLGEESLQSTVYSLQSTVYSRQSTLFCPQSTVCSPKFAVYSLQPTVHSFKVKQVCVEKKCEKMFFVKKFSL